MISPINIIIVASTHCLVVSVNAASPDSYLNLPNSVGLKFGLCNCSHNPKKSIVDRFLSQWLITRNSSDHQRTDTNVMRKLTKNTNKDEI